MDLRTFDFARDERGKWKILEGWYQNSEGSLFYYDGVVWDVIPECSLASLEYLG